MECSGQEEEFAEANQMEVTWEDREKKKRMHSGDSSGSAEKQLRSFENFKQRMRDAEAKKQEKDWPVFCPAVVCWLASFLIA